MNVLSLNQFYLRQQEYNLYFKLKLSLSVESSNAEVLIYRSSIYDWQTLKVESAKRSSKSVVKQRSKIAFLIM